MKYAIVAHFSPEKASRTPTARSSPTFFASRLLKLGDMWRAEPVVGEWWARVKKRPSVKAAIFDRIKDVDWAPFNNPSLDPWPTVQALLKAA
jgi:hypothetical protein